MAANDQGSHGRTQPRGGQFDDQRPISDRIRARFEARAEPDEAIFASACWAASRQDSPPSGAGPVPAKPKDNDALPPFEASDLDDPALLCGAAAELYRMRRARDRIMPSGLMGEPAWDILLALYSERPGDLTVSSLCYGSGVPETTALRWIGVLDREGLVERSKHQRDARITLVTLSTEGRALVERSLKAMLRLARS